MVHGGSSVRLGLGRLEWDRGADGGASSGLLGRPESDTDGRAMGWRLTGGHADGSETVCDTDRSRGPVLLEVDPVTRGEELGDTVVGVLVGDGEEPRVPADRGILGRTDRLFIILIFSALRSA
jgi:hypothetical protein